MIKILFVVILYFYYFLSKIFGVIIVSQKKKHTVCIFSPFFPENAGYHWRVKKWADILEKNGYNVSIKIVLKEEKFYRYKQSNNSLFLLIFLHKRFWQVVNSRKFDIVIVRRELLLYNDYGNLFLDKLLLKFHPNAVLDFDDDISFSKGEPRKISNLYGKIMLENGDKFTQTLLMYNRFMVATHYLKDLILITNPTIDVEKICIIPTCVDYDKQEAKKYNINKEEIVFGWVGGNHNLFLLNNIIEPLNRLSSNYKILLLVISGIDYVNKNSKFKIVNKKWSLDTEIEDIRGIDIGLMPLFNTNRDKGKAGFKLIQYMGLGVVSIASAVTVNNLIVKDNESGFLVEKSELWYDKLSEVLESKNRFSEIGLNARRRIKESFSFDANRNKYLYFFKNIHS